MIIHPVTGTQADSHHEEMTRRIVRSKDKETTEGRNNKEEATPIAGQNMKRDSINHGETAYGTPHYTRRFQQPRGDEGFQLVCHRCMQNNHLARNLPHPPPKGQPEPNSRAASKHADTSRTTGYHWEQREKCFLGGVGCGLEAGIGIGGGNQRKTCRRNPGGT